jgi:dTDP-4-dehydrorhamnose reductase
MASNDDEIIFENPDEIKEIRGEIERWRPPDFSQVVEDGRFRRIFIAGISGYVGSALAMGLRDEYEVIGSYHEHPVRIEGVTSIKMNCLMGGEILTAISRFDPDLVVYCAGVTSTDRSEELPQVAEALNFRAPAIFFKVLPKPVPFVYFGTDVIFGDPKKAPFNEQARPKSVNTLALTKQKGEAMVYNHNRLTYVFRLPAIYGEVLGGPQYPRPTWLQWLQRSLEAGEKTPLFRDQVRSSIYIGDVVRAFKKFLKKAPLKSTLLNVAPEEGLSRLEFGKLFCREFGYDENLLVDISVDDNPETTIPRPKDCRLVGKLFQSSYSFNVQTAREGLKEMSERLRTGYTKNWL